MNVFLRPLINKLKDLWVSKVETQDAVDNSVSHCMLLCCGLLMIFLLEVVFLVGVTKVTKPT